ncbi:MAG: hypothetical protein HQK60_09495 [Deltaproteobacteria bacterium]|nr:hypothetical protein [Deltaproteobacteria bacterium]
MTGLKGWWKLFLILLMVGGLGACSQAARTHDKDMTETRQLLQTGGGAATIAPIEEKVYDKSKPVSAGAMPQISEGAESIHLLELGALYNYLGEYKKSNYVLEKAYTRYVKEEEKAVVSASQVGREVVKSTVAAGVGEYTMSNYEKVFIHTLMAFNYLMLGQKEDARVEIRRADEVQKKIKEELDKKEAEAKKNLQTAEDEATKQKKSPLDLTKIKSEFDKQTDIPSAIKGDILRIRNGYQNAMTYLLSALVYDMNSDAPDDIRIDLEKAYDLSPVNDYVAKQLYLTYQKLNSQDGMTRVLQANPNIKTMMPDTLMASAAASEEQPKSDEVKPNIKKSKKKKGSKKKKEAEEDTAESVAPVPPKGPAGKSNNVHIFVQIGNAPMKERLDLRLPNPISATMAKISLPVYKSEPARIAQVKISNGTNIISNTQPLSNIELLAYRDFNDKLPIVYAQCVSRLIVQSIKDYILTDKLGFYGAIAGSVMNELLENADVRAWTSLPKTIDYSSLTTTATDLDLSFLDNTGAVVYSQKVVIQPDKVNIVNVRAYDQRCDVYNTAFAMNKEVK